MERVLLGVDAGGLVPEIMFASWVYVIGATALAGVTGFVGATIDVGT